MIRVSVLDRQTHPLDELLDKVLDRTSLSKIDVECTVLNRLKIVLDAIPDRFGYGCCDTDPIWTTNDQDSVSVLQEAENLLDLIFAREIIRSIVT